ncbi:MAG TPA: rhomboid family intramembrane serine protease [Tahibacter sp.]|uniref:rhomboid family intramembrane serine protease n=1 Tax=Tahibacter sp. TaxID=2056211 RepID=UPI002CBDA0F8|nr:rhomboid family intramembrane serine protease [Tahibacter sp.]HSX62877.1 rhomboid family intramembrane serine protease [Tahibacter sp.]
MLFFPYKLDADLYRVPFLTVLVCVVCILVFMRQMSADSGYLARVKEHCARYDDANAQALLTRTSADGRQAGCAANLLVLRDASDRSERIAAMAAQAGDLVFYTDPAKDLDYKSAKIARAIEDFESAVSSTLTGDLAYDPSRVDIGRMLTSAFAHASWGHLIGNLIFFFIFASFVESAVGYVYYAIGFLVIALAAGFAYRYSVDASVDALPSVGLSGVVMGMLALITVLMPRANVRCFLWFLVFVRRFSVPLLVLAAWYVGWDIYSHYYGPRSNTNYVAHIGGAFAGLGLGLLFRVVHRDRMRALAEEMPH